MALPIEEMTLPYLTLPYLTLPYLTLPYPTLPYPTLPYLTSPPPPRMALPIEYGTMNMAAVLSGLLFYDEAKTANSWQLGLAIASVGMVLLGIFIGQWELIAKAWCPSKHTKRPGGGGAPSTARASSTRDSDGDCGSCRMPCPDCRNWSVRV